MKTLLYTVLFCIPFYYSTGYSKSNNRLISTYSSRGCSGSENCSACKNCSGCKYCAKEGGTCGVCNPTPKKKTTLKKVKK